MWWVVLTLGLLAGMLFIGSLTLYLILVFVRNRSSPHGTVVYEKVALRPDYERLVAEWGRLNITPTYDRTTYERRREEWWAIEKRLTLDLLAYYPEKIWWELCYRMVSDRIADRTPGRILRETALDRAKPPDLRIKAYRTLAVMRACARVMELNDLKTAVAGVDDELLQDPDPSIRNAVMKVRSTFRNDVERISSRHDNGLWSKPWRP